MKFSLLMLYPIFGIAVGIAIIVVGWNAWFEIPKLIAEHVSSALVVVAYLSCGVGLIVCGGIYFLPEQKPRFATDRSNSIMEGTNK